MWDCFYGDIFQTDMPGSSQLIVLSSLISLKPGVHTNDFAPIYGRRANKLGHASLTTVFRPSRLTLPPILRENLESPVLRYQPITTAVVTDACLNTRWHHGAYISCLKRVARSGSSRDSVCGSVGAMDAELSRPDGLATVQSGRKQAQSRVCTPGFTAYNYSYLRLPRFHYATFFRDHILFHSSIIYFIIYSHHVIQVFYGYGFPYNSPF